MLRNACRSLILALIICLIGVAITAPANAQQPQPPASPQLSTPSQSQKQLDIAAARAERKALVGSNMYLSKEESRVFWPLFDQYEARMDRIEDRHIREIKSYVQNYGHLSDSDAQQKLDEVMAIAQARLEVQRAYIPKFRAVLSQIKVTRFFQIDNKIRAMTQCQIAQLVPLAQPGPTTTSDNGNL